MTGRGDEPCERSKVLANCRLLNGYTDRLSLSLSLSLSRDSGVEGCLSVEEFAVVARREPRSIFAHCSKQKCRQKPLKKLRLAAQCSLNYLSLSLSLSLSIYIYIKPVSAPLSSLINYNRH